MAKKISFQKQQMLAIALNAKGSRGAHCVTPENKHTARALERAGLVTIERTEVRCSCFKEWWVSITPVGEETLRVVRGES